jgi:hypothetical protein
VTLLHLLRGMRACVILHRLSVSGCESLEPSLFSALSASFPHLTRLSISKSSWLQPLARHPEVNCFSPPVALIFHSSITCQVLCNASKLRALSLTDWMHFTTDFAKSLSSITACLVAAAARGHPMARVKVRSCERVTCHASSR